MRDAGALTASLEPPLHAFSTARRLVGEGLGTALLLAIVIGSGIMASVWPAGTSPSLCWATRSRPAPASSS